MVFEEIDIIGNESNLRYKISPSFSRVISDYIFELVTDLHSIQVSTRDLLTDRLRSGNLTTKALANINYAAAKGIAALIQPMAATKAAISNAPLGTVSYSEVTAGYIDLVQTLVQVFNNHGGLIEVSQLQALLLSTVESNSPAATDAATGLASLLATMPNKTFNVGEFLFRFLGLARAIQSSTPLFEISHKFIGTPGDHLPYEEYHDFLQGVALLAAGNNKQSAYVRNQLAPYTTLSQYSVFDPAVLGLLFATTTSEGSVSLFQACLAVSLISDDFRNSPLGRYIDQRMIISSIADDPLFSQWYPDYALSKGIVIERVPDPPFATMNLEDLILSLELLDDGFTDTADAPYFLSDPEGDLVAAALPGMTLVQLRGSSAFSWVQSTYELLYQILFIKAVFATDVLTQQSKIRNPLFSVVDTSRVLDPDAHQVFSGLDTMFNLRRSIHALVVNTLRALFLKCVPNVEVVDGKYAVNAAKRDIEKYHAFLNYRRSVPSLRIEATDHYFKATGDTFNVFSPKDVALNIPLVELLGDSPYFSGAEMFESRAGRVLRYLAERYYQANLRKPTDNSFAMNPYHLRYFEFVNQQVLSVTVPAAWIGDITTSEFTPNAKKFRIGAQFIDQVYGFSPDPNGELLLASMPEVATIIEDIRSRGIAISKYERMLYVLIGGTDALLRGIRNLLGIDQSLIYHIRSEDRIAGNSAIRFFPRSQYNISQMDVDRELSHTLAGNFLPIGKALEIFHGNHWLMEAFISDRINLSSYTDAPYQTAQQKEYNRRQRLITFFSKLQLPEPLTIEEFEEMFDIHHLFIPVHTLQSIEELDTLPGVAEYVQLNQIDPIFSHDALRDHRVTRLSQIEVIGTSADGLANLQILQSYVRRAGVRPASSLSHMELQDLMGRNLTRLLGNIGMFGFYKVTIDRRDMPKIEKLNVSQSVIKSTKGREETPSGHGSPPPVAPPPEENSLIGGDDAAV